MTGFEPGGYVHQCVSIGAPLVRATLTPEPMERKRPDRGAERQVAQLVADHEVQLREAFGNLPCLAPGLFLFEGVDQFGGGEEADFAAMMFDGLNAEGGRDMGFSFARAADQHDVLRAIHELAAVQCPDSGLVDLAGGEVECGDLCRPGSVLTSCDRRSTGPCVQPTPPSAAATGSERRLQRLGSFARSDRSRPTPCHTF